MNAFKYLAGCFSGCGGPDEDVKTRVGEGVNTFDANKKVCNVISSGLGVKQE